MHRCWYNTGYNCLIRLALTTRPRFDHIGSHPSVCGPRCKGSRIDEPDKTSPRGCLFTFTPQQGGKDVCDLPIDDGIQVVYDSEVGRVDTLNCTHCERSSQDAHLALMPIVNVVFGEHRAKLATSQAKCYRHLRNALFLFLEVVNASLTSFSSSAF